MTRPWDVVGIGATSVDYVYRLPALPAASGPNSKVRIASHSVSCGGQTATALATCAALGLRAKFAGAIGNDANGRLVLDAMRQRGIDVADALERQAGNQFAAILVEDRTGERIVLWSRAEEVSIRASEVSAAVLASARVVHVDDVDQEAAIEIAREAGRLGAIVTSDIDRATPRTDELVAAVGIPILAEHIPEALTGDAKMSRALRALHARHGKPMCVTLGARGAMMVVEGDQIVHEPGLAVEAVDTTGAGDIFRGAFIHGLLRDAPPRELLRFANAAAALSCTRAGALDSVPTLAEVGAFLAEVPRHAASAER